MDEETTRLVNLAEVLAEQYPDAPELPSDALYWWDEDDVRAYFCSSGEEKKFHDQKAFERWFPGLSRSGTKIDGKPKMRILCFPNAGNTEDMYTHEGTGVRRAQSPLLELAKSNECEVLAVQYAGRANRKSEGYAFDIRADIVQALLPVVAGKLDEVPYCIVAHSVGTWVAFEFLQLLRSRGVRMPEQCFFSAFPFPDIPHRSRPWEINVMLNDEGFREECRRWGINELVFSMWDVYRPMLRADFHLFDKYDYAHVDKAPFDWPLTVFYGTGDEMISQEMCCGWETHTTGSFELLSIDGGHLFPLEKQSKLNWLQLIADRLEKVIGQLEGR